MPSSFSDELALVEDAFKKLKPELELSVFDRETNVQGFVVVWNTMDVPGSPIGRCGKGGTRITPTVTIDEVRMLARIMALKNAAAGLPLGGAKSGICADPDAAGFEQKYRAIARRIKPVLYENGGIFGGFGFDIGARPEHPRWVCDELRSTRSFTGKPVEMGGTDYDREGIAGLGVVVAARTALEFQGKKLAEVSGAIQGLGAMGAAVLRYFVEQGGTIRSVADSRLGGSFDLSRGVTAELQEALVKQDFDRARQMLEKGEFPRGGLEDVLYSDADILFPCAVQDVISMANEKQIRAKWVVEGANNPSSSEARTALAKRGVTVIPDFVANPGGIIAAFVEMTATITPEENARTRANVVRAKELTEKKISENVRVVLEEAARLNAEPVLVGRFLALQQILGSAASR